MRQSAFIDRVYQLRQRFLAVPVASAVAQRARGPKPGGKRLSASAEQIVGEVLQQWLPKQRELAHPLLDTWMEVRRRCLLGALVAPGRNAVARRMAEHRDAHAALLATETSAQVPAGHFTASAPLEMVQIDHTQADVEVTLRQTSCRRPIHADDPRMSDTTCQEINTQQSFKNRH